MDKKARLVSAPQIQLVGVPSGEAEAETLITDLSVSVEEILSELGSRVLQSDDALRTAVQREFGAMIRQWLGIKPKQLVNIVRI